MKKSVKDLSCVVKRFLDDSWDGVSPLAVAYSGGPDSKALLHAALEWGKAELHVVHADHAWREESSEEAALLRAEAEVLRIPFHSVRLEKSHSENEARDFRYAYFRSLREQVPYQAILLGHQADDLAETVLKRVFEGAHLTALFGMKPVSFLEGLQLWRPLLSVPRSDIVGWLEHKNLSYFSDPSNADPRYLRARMRSELLPFLSKTFGKNVLPGLLRLSERSRELEEYFSGRNSEKVIQGSLGVWIDGSLLPRVELRSLVQECLKKEGILLPRTVLEPLLDWIEQKKENFRPLERVIAHLGHFFILKKNLPKLTISEVKNNFMCIERKGARSLSLPLV